MSLQGRICKYVDIIFHFDYLFFRALLVKINTMAKVPATAAERKKNQREKMKKDGSHKIYLNKQKDLKKQQKEMEMLEKMSDDQKDEVLKEKKQKETERKALYCMKKKLENKQCNNKETSTPPKDAYKSRSSKGKAIARVKRNFPCSPRKRRAIVKELSWEQIEIKPFVPAKKRSYSSVCTKEDKKSVIYFFSRDDISRQAPGKRDMVKITLDDGSKIEKQKRHLVVPVMKVYNIWKSENPSRKIGKSTFSSL